MLMTEAFSKRLWKSLCPWRLLLLSLIDSVEVLANQCCKCACLQSMNFNSNAVTKTVRQVSVMNKSVRWVRVVMMSNITGLQMESDV